MIKNIIIYYIANERPGYNYNHIIKSAARLGNIDRGQKSMGSAS